MAGGGAPGPGGAFTCRTRILFGIEALDDVVGADRGGVVIVDPGVAASDAGRRVLAAVEASAGLVAAEVVPNPTWASVESILRRLQGRAPPWIVAVGGGSTIDTAKAVLSRVTARPRLIAVPTTAGTGSEVSAHAIITADDGRKQVLHQPAFAPDVAVLESSLVVGPPVAVRRAAGLDALTHAVESLVSTRSNPLSRALSIGAVELIVTHLGRLLEADPEESAGAAVQAAACMAGVAMSSAGLGICHALGNPLTRLRGIVHGDAVSAFLPFALSLVGEDHPGVAAIGRVWGGEAPGSIAAFLDEHGVPAPALHLDDLDEAEIDEFVDEALANPALGSFPAVVNRAAVLAAAAAAGSPGRGADRRAGSDS